MNSAAFERPIVWSPTEAQASRAQATRFIEIIRSAGHSIGSGFDELYRWSIDHPALFWEFLWQFVDVRSHSPHESSLKTGASMRDAVWFEGARLNYAENVLRYRDEQDALVAWDESGLRTVWSYQDLLQIAGSVAAKLTALGVQPGDRVAAVVANCAETTAMMLGCAWIGAVWCSCSPDFGLPGILDRFEQIAPKILVASGRYTYKGAVFDLHEKITALIDSLPSLEYAITVSRSAKPLATCRPVIHFDEISESSVHPPFAALPFNHPLYILFSSGTTGRPKCIVHGAGGTLLEHLKEHRLHCDITRKDRVFYHSTCSWMMWNWLMSGLGSGSTLVLYDGAPFHEQSRILLRMAAEERVTVFGTSAKYLALLEKDGVRPAAEFNLERLRLILSTGSVLPPESFDYVYREFSGAVQLSSISGGTDILGCFALGAPLLPVRRGELQTRSLGMRVEVYTERGEAVVGEKGELVCTAPFPSMPICFWNDPDGSKYQRAYFERFPGVWHHGDFVELSPGGGMIFHGRSDAVLNPGGVRIGTAELYRQVEIFPEVIESIAIGYSTPGHDERIILFVTLAAGAALTDDLTTRIRASIRENLTAFHVPWRIFQVQEIPRTKSGKIVELAVKEILEGREPQNTGALADPNVLAEYRSIALKVAELS